MLATKARIVFFTFWSLLLCLSTAHAADFADGDQEHLDKSVRNFMDAYQVPGLSLAFARQGRLVLSKAYGIADKNTPLTSSHRFRIASVSKPITSIAIHHLIHERKLNYSSRILGDGGLLTPKYATSGLTPDMRAITVEHLLSHTCGGWGNKRQDPMFLDPKWDQGRLIKFTLGNRKLENPPGQEYAYSNFGYCLLGRVIEEVSGLAYDKFVTKKITHPIRATSFAIGGNVPGERHPWEVAYFGQGNQNPYNMNIARMDSHGGWIATPTDLVRLAVHYDGFDQPKDNLPGIVLRRMTTASTANPNYAKGWSVNKSNNWWHMGSLPGTGAILVRAQNGFCWAVLVNTRNTEDTFFKELDRLPWKILNGVQSWPRGSAL